MSWDAELVNAGTGDTIGEWNFTHNTNVMANLVLHPDTDTSRTVAQEVFAPQNTSWWRLLDGTDGPEGAKLLDRIIDGLRADPARFRQLNPTNGWGDYDSFLTVLVQMREAIPASGPVSWSVVG